MIDYFFQVLYNAGMKQFIIGMGLALVVAIIFYFGFYSKLQKPTEQPVTNNNQQMTSNGLKIEDIKVGDGAEAKTGNTVSVNYVGTLTNGTKFDSSYDRGTPFNFTLGQGQVIQGWEKGILGMKVGGKRKLTIPPLLAYGEKGAGNVIPPNSTLVFEVELLEVK